MVNYISGYKANGKLTVTAPYAIRKAQKISDIILFDGKGYEKSIGFDNNLLNLLPSSLNKMIAGNIKIEDIPYHLNNKDFIVDLSGALENNEGKKDIKKINKLLNSIG